MSTSVLNPLLRTESGDSLSSLAGEQSHSAVSRKCWLQVVSHLDPKYGGVSAVLPQLGGAIAAGGRYDIHLAAFCNPDERYFPEPLQNLKVTHLPLSSTDWRKTRGVQAHFQEAINAASGIHIHGLWQRSTALAASLGRRAQKPYVISAHGMLEKWALANKRWKKKLYLALVEQANLRNAACLHALTRAEVQDYRRLGLKNPVAVIPNGVHIPPQPSPEAFLSLFPQLRGKRIVLFLSRIHFKKGLDILCQAWSRIIARWPEAHLVLAGPDFEGTQARVEELIRSSSLSETVTFTGMLTGETKWSALAASELFVLPSYSEGLSVSILEAMGMARPVLITENCNLPEVATSNAGVVIRATEDDLVAGLEEMLSKRTAALREIGKNGAGMVQTRYSWDAIASQMTELYGWLEGGPQPGTFELDRMQANR